MTQHNTTRRTRTVLAWLISCTSFTLLSSLVLSIKALRRWRTMFKYARRMDSGESFGLTPST